MYLIKKFSMNDLLSALSSVRAQLSAGEIREWRSGAATKPDELVFNMNAKEEESEKRSQAELDLGGVCLGTRSVGDGMGDVGESSAGPRPPDPDREDTDGSPEHVVPGRRGRKGSAVRPRAARKVSRSGADPADTPRGRRVR